MKTFEEAKSNYIKDHLCKPLKSPNIRLGALRNIEAALKEKDGSLVQGSLIFEKFNESSLLDFYQKLKAKPLNSAEKSVIHGLFKFSF